MVAGMALSARAPERVARDIIAAHRDDPDWLDQFAAAFDRHHAGTTLARILTVWDLSQSDASRLFGVSRQAVSKWLAEAPPSERAEAIADLDAATDLLVHHLKRERIPAVVRRRSSALHGESLLGLLEQSGARAVLQACRAMFDFERAHA